MYLLKILTYYSLEYTGLIMYTVMMKKILWIVYFIIYSFWTLSKAPRYSPTLPICHSVIVAYAKLLT
jgi:hypothetical protein